MCQLLYCVSTVFPFFFFLYVYMYCKNVFQVQISLNKEAVNPMKAKRIRPDEDAKFWCQAGLDKDGFEKRFINNTIGFGVFTTAFFQKGAFLLEYVGNRISEKEAEIRERKRRKKKHSYMFHFKWNGKHVVDATDVPERMCRYVNDDKKANATMKLKVFNNYPRLCSFALQDIHIGEEIRYDYGDENVPWRQHFHKTKMEMKTIEVTDDDDDDPFDLKKPRFSEKKEQCQSKAKVSCMLEMIDLVMMMT
ncbi:N-lysine methyltransferase KMT5A-A-like isoform X1 [Magallana gigas]|uniref:N-lysine methyltransferase KMT5A-A-like isoform X1 n=1 Tax=Magallana gigas TaxID=29159 RepID=UPI003340960C